MHMSKIIYAIWSAMVEMPLPPECKKVVERTTMENATQLIIIDDELYKITVEKLN